MTKPITSEDKITTLLKEHGPLTAAAMHNIQFEQRLARLPPFWRDKVWLQFLIAMAHGLSSLYPALMRLEHSRKIDSRWIDPIPGSKHRRREYFLCESEAQGQIRGDAV